MEQIKILIADDNEALGKHLEEVFTADKGFNVVGVVTSGAEALEVIKKENPDVCITDIILSGADGFWVMEETFKLDLKTKFLVLTALSSETFVTKSLSLGASYYMVKPISDSVLEKRVLDIVYSQNISMSSGLLYSKNKQLEEKISNIFITVGIPAHIKGYQFLREAIKLAIEKPEIINSITKELYPSIASHFSTSASKVERAIRHAIEVAWNRGKIENINTVFGIKVYNNNEKPTNGEFIALVADKMLMEGFGD